MSVVNDVEWEKGDFIMHVPMKPYDGVMYIGSFMNIDISRYYRYLWWTNRHIYYGVTEGPPVLSNFNVSATKYMNVIVPSNYVKWELENYGISVSDVIPHGIDIYGIRKSRKSIWRKIFGDKIVVLYVAHRNIRKGFKYLVDAWKMSKAGKDSNVILVLHTERNPNINEGGYIIPEEFNIVVTDGIHKFGRESLYGLYNSADIYIHGALSEGFGIPIVEAMAAGKPVLCIDAPPMNEHITDKRALVKVDRQEIFNDRGVAKYRFNIPDMKDYAEKIDSLVYDKSLRHELGEKNMEKSERYEINKVYGNFRKWLKV